MVTARKATPADRLESFDRIAAQLGTAEAIHRVYGYGGKSADAALRQDREAARRASETAAAAAAAAAAANEERRAVRLAQKASDRALDRFIAAIPWLTRYSAPLAPPAATVPSLASVADDAQYETIVANPAAVGRAIVAAGELARAGGRKRPGPNGLAGAILAAGRRRRGESI